MNKLTILVIAFLLLMPLVAAEKIINFEVYVSKTNQVTIKDIHATFGSIDEVDVFAQPYRLQATDYSTYVPLTFKLLVDPPRDIDEELISRKLPYASTGRINLYNNDQEIFSFDLAKLCNNDNVCGEFENVLSCSDCSPLQIDGLCIESSDGVCDPDCVGNLDSDCLEEKVVVITPIKSRAITILLVVFGVVIPLLLIFRLWYHKKH